MSFGWVLATPDGRLLVKLNDPCNSRVSHWKLKNFGMLSISMFIALLTKHEQRTDLLVYFVITDNLELVNRSNKHFKYKHPYPNNTLKSEYNIMEQIYLTCLMYNIIAIFYHVYGHQDIKKSRNLSMKEIMNIEAIKLAGTYQENYGVYKPITHIILLSTTVLYIIGTTITSNIFHQL